MKNKINYIYLALLLCFFFNKTYCQSHNLQFNQVYSYSGYLFQGESGPSWVVPDGKVWKVEYFTQSFFVLNNARAGGGTANNGPLWLKAGDSIRYDLNFWGANCCGASSTYLISIIEFNLIP